MNGSRRGAQSICDLQQQNLAGGVLLEVKLERVGVIETPSSDWKSEVLPLNYTRRCIATANYSNCRPIQLADLRTYSRTKGLLLIFSSFPID